MVNLRRPQTGGRIAKFRWCHPTVLFEKFDKVRWLVEAHLIGNFFDAGFCDPQVPLHLKNGKILDEACNGPLRE